MLEDETASLGTLTRLAAQRRRWFWRIAFSIIVLAVLATILVLTLVDTRLSLSSGIRWGLWFACLGVAMICLIREKWRTSKRYSPQEAARAVEAEADIGQQLRTALEVATASSSPFPGSHGFGKQLVSETERWLREYDWRNLIPRSVAGRWLAFTATVAASLFVSAAVWPEFGLGLRRILLPATTTTYTQVEWEDPPEWFDQRHPPLLRVKVSGREAIPRLFIREEGSEEWKSIDLTPRENSPVWDVVLSGRENTLVAYATAGDGKTEPLTLQFDRIPELREARVSLTYPDYLGREPETRNGGDVRTIEGTRVSWTFFFDIAPAKVEWTVTGEGNPRELEPAEICVAPVHDLQVGTQNPTLTIFDRRGSPVDSWRYEAVGLADKLPTIEILEPAKDLDATSITELPVRIRAKDDYGLGEVGVVLEAAGETKWLMEKVIDVSDQRQASEMITAMLEEVPLDITDNVRLYAYALDRKPRGGPRALSHLRSIDIRQFKRRWMFRVMPPMSGEGEKAPKMEDIAGLEKIIEGQREIVSEIFVLKGGGRDSLSQELVEKSAGEAAREEALSLDVEKLANLWEKLGRIEKDDIVLLQVAGDQMVEAANQLRIPERDEAFEIADSSLSNLLRLRKKLMTLILKSKSKIPGEPMEPQERPPELMSLADEARRLAREEADVRSQIEDEKLAAAIDPKVIRRQQDVAVYDAGELYSNLLTHPEKTDGALSLMAEAEEFMREADQKLDSGDEAEAAPQLALAEQRLLELAEFLELLELEMTSAALEDLAEQAEKDAKELAESQSESQSEGSSGSESEVPSEGEEEKGESESEKGEDQSTKMAENGAEPGTEGDEKPGEGESAAEEQKGKGKGQDSGKSELAGSEGESGSESGESGDSSGENRGEEKGSGADGKEGTGEGSESGKSIPDAIAQAARRARLTDEILKALEERERMRNQAGKMDGGEQDDENGEGQGDEKGEGQGGEKGEGQGGEKGEGQGGEKGEGQGGEKGEGQGDEKGEGQGGEKGEGQGGEKGEGQGGEKGEGKGGEKGEGKGDEKGEGQGGEKGEGQGDEKGEGQGGEKGEGQGGEKGEGQGGEKGEGKGGEKGEGQGGEKGEGKGGEKGEGQGGERGEGKGGEKGEGQGGEKGEGQGGEKGEGQGGEKGEGQGGEKGEGKGGEKGEGQGGEKGEGNAPGSGGERDNGEGQGTRTGGSRERALAELRKNLRLGELAEALEEAAEEHGSGGKGKGNGKGGKGGSGESLKDLAARLNGAGGRMRDLAKDLDASELAQLAELKSEIAELKNELESGDGSGDGDGKDGENPFATGDGGEDNPFDGVAGGDDRLDGKSGGIGPGPGPDPKPHLGPDAEEFANRLDRLEDETVRRWGRYLRDIPFDRNSLPILDAIEKRLDELVAEIPQSSAVTGGRRKVPEDRRREIEDYFRDLSEDFGGESWIKR